MRIPVSIKRAGVALFMIIAGWILVSNAPIVRLAQAQPSGGCSEVATSGAPVIIKSHVGSIDVYSGCLDTGTGTPQWTQFWPANGTNGIAANSILFSNLDSHIAKTSDITLTNPQLLALFTTPITLVAAQGAGSLIEVMGVTLENVYGTAAFTSGGVISINYKNGGTLTAAATTIAATFLTSPTANQSTLLTPALASALSSNVVNMPVVITNATGNFATGDGTVIVHCRYRVHTGL